VTTLHLFVGVLVLECVVVVGCLWNSTTDGESRIDGQYLSVLFWS